MTEQPMKPNPTESAPALWPFAWGAPSGSRDPFDRMFQAMAQRWPGMPAWRDPPELRGGGGFDIVPTVDTAETEAAYEVSVELPGVDEKDTTLTIEDGVLKIRGEKRTVRDDKRKDYHLTERSFGVFERAFRLPENVDADRVSAAFEKGVLKVTLPKAADQPARQRIVRIGK